MVIETNAARLFVDEHSGYISCFKLMVIETSYLCRGGLQVVGYISCLRLMVIETTRFCWGNESPGYS